MELILIRHGESTANAIKEAEKRIFIGQWDCDLTENGIQQALSIRNNPIIENADAFFCSDLKRAVATARLITDGNVIIDKRLRERSLGIFEGILVSEIKASPTYHEYFDNPEYSQFRHGFDKKAPKGENYCDVCERVSSFLNELDRRYNKVVIVSHYCAIRCIIKTVKNLTNEETLALNVKNCEPIKIEYE